MNTQNLLPLQVFQLFSRKCKSHFLQSFPQEFIRFLCECIVNLIKGKLPAIKRHHVVKFQDDVWLPLPKRTIWKQRRNVLSSEEKLQLIAVMTPPVICLNMEQCDLVPASVYNKSVTEQSVTKQELPNSKSEQPITYQIDSLKRDINKKLFGKADP